MRRTRTHDMNKKTKGVKGGHFGAKWPLFELSNQLKLRQHVHNISLPRCKQGGGRHMPKCSRANTCPDHTLGCFYQRTHRSSANIQPVASFTRYRRQQRRQRWAARGGRLWRKLEAICYIHAVYKQISELRNR